MPAGNWSSETAPTSSWNAGYASPTTTWVAGCASPSTVWANEDATIATPANLTATGVSYSEIDLTWNDVTGATSFELQRDGVTIATLGAGVLSYQDTGLVYNSAHTYAIRACGAPGCSAWSGLVLGTALDWTSIAGRVLWLDASNAASITQATGVSAWADASGNGRGVTQATGAKQPTLVANSINGLAVVRFDGTAMYLSTSWNVELANGNTILVVAKVRFANDTLGRPLIRCQSSNANGIQHEPSNDPNAPSRSMLEAFVTTSAGLKRATPTVTTTQTTKLLTSVVDLSGSGAITLYKNGSVSGGPTSPVAGLTSSVNDTLFLAFDNVVSYGLYDIAEVIVFNVALGTTDRQTIETNYLTPKWGPFA